MGTDIIAYAAYHPHLGYALAITCMAWVAVIVYSQLHLCCHPKRRIAVYATAIGLPIYAEVTSALIHLPHPAPDTPVGYFLVHLHAYVIQRTPNREV